MRLVHDRRGLAARVLRHGAQQLADHDDVLVVGRRRPDRPHGDLVPPTGLRATRDAAHVPGQPAEPVADQQEQQVGPRQVDGRVDRDQRRPRARAPVRLLLPRRPHTVPEHVVARAPRQRGRQLGLSVRGHVLRARGHVEQLLHLGRPVLLVRARVFVPPRPPAGQGYRRASSRHISIAALSSVLYKARVFGYSPCAAVGVDRQSGVYPTWHVILLWYKNVSYTQRILRVSTVPLS